MAQTFAQLLPWVIAGAFLPTWTSYVTLVLGTDRPLTTASSYVLGNASWRFVLGFTTLFVVSVAAPGLRAAASPCRRGGFFVWVALQVGHIGGPG